MPLLHGGGLQAAPFYQTGCPKTMLLLIFLIVLLFAAVPTWPYSREWGYYPSGALGAIVLVVTVLVLWGHLNL